MSTFSGLNTAYSGLVAARKGLDVVGQNIANVNTEGYTRQRVTTSSIEPPGSIGLTAAPVAGGGVTVDGVARLGDIFLDARVRSSSASAGYWSVRANVLSSLETTLREPGDSGLSTQLQEFWAAWQGLSNDPTEPAPVGLLLEQADVLVTQIAHGYQEIDDQWAQVRREFDGMVSELNDAASQVADLNTRIRSTVAAGGSVNELLDRRSVLMTTIASLAGGTSRELADGTVEVLIGGNAIVSGETFRPVKAAGAYSMKDAAGDAPRLVWEHRPTAAVSLDGGEAAGALAVLAPPAAGGSGGAIAEAAESYNTFANSLAAQVNAIHNGKYNSASPPAPVGDFFQFTPGMPAALGLAVIPTDGSGIATGASTDAPNDGSVADAIAQLGVAPGSPDSVWSSFVVRLGVTSRSESQQASLAGLAAASAANLQLSTASVDVDEENVNLLSFQVAYQGAARVLTAVDQMLDTLINRTGIVGR